MATSRLSTRRVDWRVQVGTNNKAAQGLVIFEASVSYIPDPLAAGGPRTAIPEPVPAVLDAAGYACTPDPANPARAGERGVDLFTTDSLGEDGGDWTWTARPQLRSVNGIQMANAVPAFSFAVPTGTGTLDLATVQKVPASPGLGTDQAIALTALAQQAANNSAEDSKTAKRAALEAARAAAVAVGPVDSAIDEGIQRANLPATYARTTLVRDIRDFLRPGETLDPTNTRSMSEVFQRAVDELSAEYDRQRGTFGDLGFQIYVPNGFYRFDTKLSWRRGVGIVGESNIGTIFLPRAWHSFIDGSFPEAGYNYTDCNFRSFAVDGRFQASSTYSTGVKGIYIQHMKRSSYDTVIIRNTWATGFGVDQLEDTSFINCIADNCGRGLAALNDDPATHSGHSGFGIGTGASTLEAVSIINCIARNCGLYGIFSEKQPSQPHYPNGFRVIGCIATGNYIGFKDCGSTGAVVQGNQFINNTHAGAALNGTILAPNAGKDGILSGNIIAHNGTGIILGMAALGGYRISGNEIYGNTKHGIHAHLDANLGQRYKITDNSVHENGGDGIRIEVGTELLTIARNEIYGNGGTDLALLGAATAYQLNLTGNDLRGATVDIQQVLVDATIETNPGMLAGPQLTLAGIAGGIRASWQPVPGATSYVVSYRPTGATDWTPLTVPAGDTAVQIAGLIPGRKYQVRVAYLAGGLRSVYTNLASLAGEVYDLDTFDRADTSSGLGRTSGGKEWLSTSWRISDKQAKAPDGVANAFARLPIGAANRTVTATFKTVPGGLAVRATDENNWIGLIRASSGNWTIQRRQGGTHTVLRDTGVIARDGDTVTVRANGNDFGFTINHGPFLTITDATFPTQQSIILRGVGGTVVDNLSLSEA